LLLHDLTENKIIHHSLTFSCNTLKCSILPSDGRLLNHHQTITFWGHPSLFRAFFIQMESNLTVLMLKINKALNLQNVIQKVMVAPKSDGKVMDKKLSITP